MSYLTKEEVQQKLKIYEFNLEVDQMAKSPISNLGISGSVMFSRYKAIGVKFTKFNTLSEKQYTTFTDIKGLVEGDMVVCDTQCGPSVAVVTQIDGLSKFDKDNAERLVISKINMKKVQKEYKKMKELQELRSSLQERKAEMEEFAVLRLLAEKDPTAKAMIDKMFKLTGDATFQLEEPAIQEEENGGGEGK